MSRASPLFRLLLVALVALAVRPAAHDPITTKVTWTREIAPIVAHRCTGCHRPGGPAPMSLESYGDARPWAKAMRAEVVTFRMPRWAPVSGFGHFANDRSLSAFEISLISAWAAGGAPEGEDPLPAEWGWTPGVRFGETVKLEKRTKEPAGERRTLLADRGTPSDTWVTGWRFFANDPAIVQAEFALAGGPFIGNWVPPEQVVRTPEGSGIRLPAGAQLSVTVSYREARLQQDFPVGLPSLPPVLAFVTSQTPPARTLETTTVSCGESPLDFGAQIVGVRPVSAREAGALAVALLPPDAPPVPLVRIREFDPSHLETYRLREPFPIPPGSRVFVEGPAAGCRVQLQVVRD